MKNLFKKLSFLSLIVLTVFVGGAFSAWAYSYNQNPSTFGPFPKAGEVRMYYFSGNGIPELIRLVYQGNNYNVTPANGDPKQGIIVNTGISVQAGDYLKIFVKDPQGPSLGWMPPSDDNKCGTGAPNGNGGHYAIIDVTNWINTANQAGEPLVSKQCWADWPEWSGDLDFNDYFIVFSYVPQTGNPPTVDLKVNGSDGPITLTAPANYTLSWTSSNANTCTASGSWAGTKSLNGSEAQNNVPQGTYTYTLTCSNNFGSASDSVTVYVVPPSSTVATLSISKLVRDPAITTSANYYENLYMIPGREVEFSLTVTVTGSTQATNVYLRDSLPAGLVYLPGSTTVDGVAVADGIVSSSGIFLGNLLPNQTKVVKFRARIEPNSYFTQSLTQLVNTAYSSGGNATQVSDTATVWVVKQGQVLGAAAVDTGAEAGIVNALIVGLGSAFSLSSFQLGRRLYWKKRIMLARQQPVE